MKRLIGSVNRLKRGPIGRQVESRMAEFSSKGSSGDDEIFKELCFCLLTANYTSEGGIRIQREIGDGFMSLSRPALSMRLRTLGYRFPNARARYIVEARGIRPMLGQVILTGTEKWRREWLAENVLGLGYKEASHFLRNIGQGDLAIIDFHIIDLLARHSLIRGPKPKSLTKGRYLEIEGILGRIASGAGISQGELDLYLWYMETGKILK
ncbi:MAG: N-glycosylase/DNA lyase [Candidatus Micrarchaeia archaeon]